MKVVVIVVRGLQAGALACYGDPVAETPSLDALAAEGIVCDSHLADGADEAAARRGWRSGRYFPSAPPDLLASLRGAGIRTHLVVDGTRPVDDAFADGWDEADGVLPDKDETPLEATIAVAEETLETLAERDKWLLWVELGSLLPPWNVPDEFLTPFFQEEVSEEEEEDDDEEDEDDAEPESEEETVELLTPLTEPQPGPIDMDDSMLYLRLRNTYEAAVSYVDAGIGKLWDAVTTLGLGEDLLFLVTADVGLPLGEHGIVGPGLEKAHQEIVHIPCIVRFPGGVHGGRRVTGLTQGVDLLPTLAAFFGVAVPQVDGRDLLPLLRGEVEQVRRHAWSSRRVGSETFYALRTLEWAYLSPLGATTTEATGVGQLFIKPDDRYEVDDVASQYLEIAEELERTLRTAAKQE